jgi:hypothetical protein
VKAGVKMTGPFFRHDPEKTFRSNASVMLHGIVDTGKSDVIMEMRSGQGKRAPIRLLGDRVADHVEAGMKANQPRLPTASVYVRNEGFSRREGKSLMAAASKVESRTHAFRKVAGRLRRARGVNWAELLKGIA